MPQLLPDHRRGMSLVELLVVIAILGLLAVTVLPNLANTGERRKVREAARQVSSFVAGAQSRAIGSREGFGIWIDPLGNRVQSEDGLAHIVAIDFFFADVPEPYAGESLGSVVTPKPDTPFNSDTLELTFSNTLPQALSPFSKQISFAGSPTRFRLDWDSSTEGSAARLGELNELNQTYENTPWPVSPRSGGLPYEIFFPATRSAVESLTLADSVAADLTWTVVGTRASNWPAPPGLPPESGTALEIQQFLGPMQLLYDGSGNLSTAVRAGGRGLPVLEPVYFLIAPIEAIQDGTCFTKPGAFWVAMSPQGGIPKVAEVQLITGIDQDLVRPLNQQHLHFTQQFIRQ